HPSHGHPAPCWHRVPAVGACNRPAARVGAFAAAWHTGWRLPHARPGSDNGCVTTRPDRSRRVRFRVPESRRATETGDTYCAPPLIVGSPSSQTPPLAAVHTKKVSVLQC